MDLGLEGKVAIVTGGSMGLGKAIARQLSAEGASVAICGRGRERLDSAVDQLNSKAPGRIFGMVADVANGKAVRHFVDSARERFGGIHILVNNAGTHKRGTIDDMGEEDLDHHLHEKVFGFLAMIRAVLPAMRKQGDGRIVNVIGQAARHPHPDRLPSGITNAGLMAMTKSIADTLARENIRANAVCPQYIETELVETIITNEMRERGVDRDTAAAGFTRANVVGRLGKPEEVAALVAFLVSDRATYICGTAVSVDGGYHRYVFG